MIGYYGMDGEPISEAEAMRLMGSDERIVAQTESHGVLVSTVLLIFDHRFGGSGPPLIFETMIFGGREGADQTTWRYSTREQAELGHAAACELVFGVDRDLPDLFVTDSTEGGKHGSDGRDEAQGG